MYSEIGRCSLHSKRETRLHVGTNFCGVLFNEQGLEYESGLPERLCRVLSGALFFGRFGKVQYSGLYLLRIKFSREFRHIIPKIALVTPVAVRIRLDIP